MNLNPNIPTRTVSNPGLAHHPRGFALIITVAMMVLLTVLAVGLLSLSTITLQSNSLSSAEEQARANARMALMMAIGRLQEEMGPDQRISANASITELNDSGSSTDVEHRHWVGVWDSWKANDSNPAGSDAKSHHSTIGAVGDSEMHPSYTENREDHFRSWLVSLTQGDASDISSPQQPGILTPKRLPGGADTAVYLVDQGSLGELAPDRTPDNPNNLDDRVAAPLIKVEPGAAGGRTSGRYAWWVGDESQKARVLKDSFEDITNPTDAEEIYRAFAPASMGTEMIKGLENVVDDKELERAVSRKTLDLITVDPAPAVSKTKVSQANFHHATNYSMGVIADVREGGLKRDLNTILEQPIELTDNGDPFMLYRFNGDDERVPIQDLSAYYQLYRDLDDSSSAGRGGIKYSSSRIQTDVPDYGENYMRQYTALYRNPVPVKVQFILGIGASEITEEERQYALSQGDVLRAEDRYKLSLGVKPVVSLWNPSNVPMVMNRGASQEMRVGFPPFVIRWKKYRAAGGEFETNYVNLNYAITNESTNDGRARSLDPFIFKVQFAKNSPITFEPGEIKTFTVDINTNNWLENDGEATFGDNALYEAQEFFPDGFYVTAKVAPPRGVDVVKLEGSSYQGFRMVFAEGDKITFAAYPEAKSWSRAVARANEIRGGGLQFYLRGMSTGSNYSFRNYQLISRFGQDGDSPNQQTTIDFNADLIMKGFPNGEVIPYESETDAMPGASGPGNIKSYTDAGSAKGLLMFTMMPGCELNNQYTAGFSAGRRITTRPFIHGSILSAPLIAENTPAAIYDYGWEWQVEKINDTEEVLQDDGNSRGFYGGGYNTGSGSTHVVQQYLPVLPPISIASLSSARLGGYSLADNAVVNDNIKNAPELGDFRQTTATGQGGLAPHTLQAIGNSYAHPNIPANKAFTSYVRRMNMDQPAENQEITYADHSYLANKALWDEFFFSSITPEFTDVDLQEVGADRTAAEVAEDFLFNDAAFPNRRIASYKANLNQTQFDQLESQYSDFADGFADKIASHLMITGPFNINSTSTEAWKVLLTSLRDKSVAHLDSSSGDPSVVSTDGETPVGPGMLPNHEPVKSGQITSSSNNPADQWTSWRSLSDAEIEQLAEAIVHQVKRRGPFLSLSDFINRRLDGSNIELATKGTLQAAIDFEGNSEVPEVTINSAFRTPPRSLDGEAANFAAGDFEFPEALEGPVAYGSTPYIDQADLLRHLGSVLTPRGDSYVIRAYGDSLDSNGNVAARAWCEAVVQRTPDYVDLSSDENHFTQAELSSDANKTFGRKFEVISFRWLNSNEV